MYRYYLWHSVGQQAKSLKSRPPQEIWDTGEYTLRTWANEWTLKQLDSRRFWNVVCVPTDTVWLRRLTLLWGRHQLFHTSIICCRGSSHAPRTASSRHTHPRGWREGVTGKVHTAKCLTWGPSARPASRKEGTDSQRFSSDLHTMRWHTRTIWQQ